MRQHEMLHHPRVRCEDRMVDGTRPKSGGRFHATLYNHSRPASTRTNAKAEPLTLGEASTPGASILTRRGRLARIVRPVTVITSPQLVIISAVERAWPMPGLHLSLTLRKGNPVGIALIPSSQ